MDWQGEVDAALIRARVQPELAEAEAKPGDLQGELRIPCEVYSRIVGYLRPIQQWNQAKQLEFKERRVFRLEGK